MKYFICEPYCQPKEVDFEDFLELFKREFLFGPNYYEHSLMLIAHGQKLVGSRHMFWMEW